jgi:hypothetical protein
VYKHDKLTLRSIRDAGRRRFDGAPAPTRKNHVFVLLGPTAKVGRCSSVAFTVDTWEVVAQP